ncbi:MAG: YidC/Oxa1 family membrane protein insertase [Eubacterium sp.]|nr:YidC/Oxa1 family membrane protein insertase [Eubacterium sp.]
MIATAYVGTFKIFGYIAMGLGWIMNLLYEGLCAIGINNIGITIVILTILIYTAMLPLTYKQQKFSRLSRKMSPELKALQEKYKGKRDQASQQAMMEEQREIYDKYGISPTGSCLQSFISILVLFPLYRVISNVPAYVTRVKETLMPAVDGIMSTDDYQSVFDSVVSEFGISLSNIGVKTTEISSLTETTDIQNRIVDILYKCSPANWDTLIATFPSVDLTSVEEAFSNINTFLMINVTYSPQYSFMNGIKTGDVVLIIFGLLIPILAALSQLINLKLMPQVGNGDDAMERQMKMMNYMMPLMSLFFCFTLPFGLGIYWIVGALIRSVYQFFLNKHFDKIDLNDIIEANREKAAKKKEKRGINIEKMQQAARLNTKTLKSSSMTEEEREELLAKADEIKKNAQPGSLAARANIVREFNEGIKK